jgi:Protein of unknown function (DUF3558)
MTVRKPALALAAALLLAACGGGTAATSGPGGPTAGPGGATANPATAATGGQPTTAPIATPNGGPGGPGGEFTGDPCSLLTAAEIEQATGVANVVGTSTPMLNFVGGCSWTGDDNTFGATITVSATPDTQTLWQLYTSDAASEALPGIGDGAIFYRGAVLVLKGGTIVTTAAGPFLADEATRKASSIELARVIAGKL